MREFIALAVFVAGFSVYDARDGGDGVRIAALLMMLGSAFFLCCAVVERIFFLPRLMKRRDPADDIGVPDAPQNNRHDGINYAGPRVPRAFSQDPHHGPDGLDPIPSSEQYYVESGHPGGAETGGSRGEIEGVVNSGSESGSEDDHVFHEEMKSTLTDPFFSGGKSDGDGK